MNKVRKVGNKFLNSQTLKKQNILLTLKILKIPPNIVNIYLMGAEIHTSIRIKLNENFLLIKNVFIFFTLSSTIAI